METDQFTRRVCAILLADVTGYSALMGVDDERAARAVEHLHAMMQEIIGAAGGHAEPVAGDALFATFDSVVAAVTAALHLQERIAAEEFAGTRLQIRIGIHLGDVLVREARMFGDAINIAARLQALARPGTICISDGVYRHVRNRFNEQFVDLGKQRLKNISDPVHAYLIVRNAGRRSGRNGRRALLRAAVAVAVLGGLVAALVVARRVQHSGLGAADQQDQAPAKEAKAALRPLAAQSAAVREAPSAAPVTLGVMGFKSHGTSASDDWQGEALRDGLNAQLSRLSGVKVYSKEFIDFLITRQGLSEVEAATKLGISKMLSGSVVRAGDSIHIETHIVDVATGVLDSSYVTETPAGNFSDLQSRLALGVITHLNLPVTAEERRVLLAQRNIDPDALRRLLEAESGAAGVPGPSGSRELRRCIAFALVAAAWADDARDQEAVRDLLERYRQATEAHELELLAGLYADFPPEQQAAQQRYFENVRDLKVALDSIDIAVVGDEAVASYTRTDDFIDAKTGRSMHVSVRLTKMLRRSDQGWKLVAK